MIRETTVPIRINVTSVRKCLFVMLSTEATSAYFIPPAEFSKGGGAEGGMFTTTSRVQICLKLAKLLRSNRNQRRQDFILTRKVSLHLLQVEGITNQVLDRELKLNRIMQLSHHTKRALKMTSLKRLPMTLTQEVFPYHD